jgi:2-dehydropantoate 2-reductase|tara:strand:- start:125 stop:967 length:843 start_codon:yes stop_codon:yes gene_type:complete
MLSRKMDVLLIGRQRHIDAIKSRGLELTGAIDGVFDLDVSTEIRGNLGDSLIILTTKAYDIEKTINKIRGVLRSNTTILVLQNGLGNEDLVQALVGPEVDVIRGLVSTGVEFLSPGRIEVKLVRDTVLPKTAKSEKIERLFTSCGLQVRLSERMDTEIWRKLTMNCVINPLSALFCMPSTEIAVDGLREVRKSIVDECIRVAEREGVNLDGDLEGEISRAAASYSNLSSMCQDIMKGRKTEIDFLNGKISELGRRHKVPTPVNDVFILLIQFMRARYIAM